MKKIMFLATMVLAVTVGTAYANHLGGAKVAGEHNYLPKNGVSVLCTGPVAFDSVPIITGRSGFSFESSAAGGVREEATAMEPYNGATVFSYGPATFDAVPLGIGSMTGTYFEESAAAGGLRAGEESHKLYNGVTDFSGRSYDTVGVGM